MARPRWVDFLLVPLAHAGWRLIWYPIGTLLAGYCIVAFNVVQVSHRQAACPDHLLGRMNATTAFLFRVTVPVGALLGGITATTLGTRTTLAISGLGILATTGWLTPLRHVSPTSLTRGVT